MHQSPAGFRVSQGRFEYGFNSAEGAVSRCCAGINRTADGCQHVGSELRQALHILQAGVEITAGDHRSVERFKKPSGNADQFVLHRFRFGGAGHDLAAGETGAVQIVLVGHQPGESLAISNAGLIARVIEQAKTSIGRTTCIRVFGHHEHRQMVGHVFSKHRDVRRRSCCCCHQATFSIIWWCST